MTTPVKPEDCMTMAEVRDARIKDRRDAIRDEARKAQVIDHAAGTARKHGVPEQLIREIYELLVETSIAHELDCFDQRHTGNA